MPKNQFKIMKNFFYEKYQKSVPTTEYRYRHYFVKIVPLSVPWLLFWQSIITDIVGTFKVPSAHLCPFMPPV